MVKHTKTELKKQKDALRRFQRYLPTLQLKQQQLQLVIRQLRGKRDTLLTEQETLRSEYRTWIAVFSDDVSLSEYLSVEECSLGASNIAGVDIPVFQLLRFRTESPDLFSTPLWLSDGIALTKEVVEQNLRIEILEEAILRLEDELRITTQRVNLFEKVRIPDTEKNIRTIRIFLSDVQTAEVVRGKIAKRKLLERSQ